MILAQGSASDIDWRTDGDARLVADFDGARGTLVLERDCDLTAFAPARRLLREAAALGVKDLRLDFSHVAFADTTAVRLALAAREELASAGGRVSIVGSPATLRVFELTQTSALFSLT